MAKKGSDKLFAGFTEDLTGTKGKKSKKPQKFFGGFTKSVKKQ